jgi:hypothetical protein
MKQIRKSEKEKKKKEKNMEKGPGDPNRPSQETGPRPIYPFQTGIPPSLFLSLTLGTHLSACSPLTVSPPSPVTSPELLPRHHRDLIVHQTRSYKTPTSPSPFFPFSLSGLRPQAARIARRTPAHLQAFPADSDAAGEPRIHFFVLSPPPRLDASP